MYLNSENVEIKIFNRELMLSLGILNSEDQTEYEFHYATEGACAFDLFSVISEPLILHPFVGPYSIPTGIGIQVFDSRQDFGLLMIVSSSMSHRGVALANQVALIDSDYQGEIVCKIFNDNKEHRDITIVPGERLVQAILFPTWRFTKAKIVNEFRRKTQREDKGFGHTSA